MYGVFTIDQVICLLCTRQVIIFWCKHTTPGGSGAIELTIYVISFMKLHICWNSLIKCWSLMWKKKIEHMDWLIGCQYVYAFYIMIITFFFTDGLAQWSYVRHWVSCQVKTGWTQQKRSLSVWQTEGSVSHEGSQRFER